MRFLGNSEAKTDAKGRVFLPAVSRKTVWFFTPKMCGTNK